MGGRTVRRDVGEALVFYTEPGQGASRPLPSSRDYAAARAAIPTFSLDGLVCGRTADGVPAVVLLRRAAEGDAAGPFRDEPWVVGGRWDMVTPFEQFVRRCASQELLDGADPPMEVSGPLGPQLFATGWDSDGPYGQQGVTVQYCFQVVLNEPLEALGPRADAAHSEVIVVRGDRPMPRLHPLHPGRDPTQRLATVVTSQRPHWRTSSS